MRRMLGLVVLAAAPLFATEIAVAPPVVKHASTGGNIAAATDGAGVLAVWSDFSRLRYAVVGHGPATDPPARLLASREPPSYYRAGDFAPVVAFAEGRYLIVWQDDFRVDAALLDRDGEVLRRFSIAEDGGLPFVASASGWFLVAWTTSARSGAAAILSPDGDVISSMSLPFPVVAACASAGAFAVLGAPQPLDCTTSTKCTFRHPVMRVAPDGHVTAQANVDVVADWPYPPDQYAMASGSDGGLLIACDVYDDRSSRGVGLLLDFALRRVSGTFDVGDSGDGRLTTFWDRSHYVVVTNSGFYGARAMRVGIDCMPIEIGSYDSLDRTFGIIVPTDAGYFVIVGPGYSIHDSPIEAIFHPDLRLDSAFDHRATERWRFTIVDDQSITSIATDGRSVLSGWMLPDGTQKNALISNGSARDLPDSQTFPVAFDGTNFVSRSGCPDGGLAVCGAGPVTMRFRSAGGMPAEDVTVTGVSSAIWNGNLFFGLTLHLESPDVFNYPLTVTRILRSGAPLDSGIFVATGDLLIVSSTTNGRDAFFVLQRHLFPSLTPESIIARVTPDGAVTTSQPLPFDWPKLAAAGDAVFVTGTQWLHGVDSVSVASYTADLRPRWPAPIELSAGDTPDIAADGRDAVVVWHEPRRIAGARVAPDGNASPFVVVEGSDPLSQPRVAAARGGIAVAYERLVSKEPYRGARRVFVHILDAPPRRRASVP